MEHPSPTTIAAPNDLTFLEAAFPVRELSILAAADRRSNDPIYGVHRWWARRPPTLMRGLLLAAALPATIDTKAFWTAFASADHVLAGLRVHDPFIGGGTTLVEASRLGATVSGGDVDPLAVEIVRHELSPPSAEEVRQAGAGLLTHLQEQVGHLYPTSSDAPNETPLHYFWLHEVTCPACQAVGLLYRNLILVRDVGKSGAVVRDKPLSVFCPDDLSLHHLDRHDRRELRYAGRHWKINDGTFHSFRYHCRECGKKYLHKELQTGLAPRRLIAIETAHGRGTRRLRSPDALDMAAVVSAQQLITAPLATAIPDVKLSTDRQDERPLSFGIETIAQLFTERQLAVFATSRAWIANADLDPAVKRAVALGVSNALGTNNRLCSYATDYGRLSALFSVRGFPLPALPVELNPLHPSGGRGTLHQCIERVARSSAPTVQRYVWSAELDRPVRQKTTFRPGSTKSRVERVSAAKPTTGKVDLCIFDPPYFDYINYSELSEFYRAWWSPNYTTADEPLLPRGPDAARRFGSDFGKCLHAVLVRLRANRPIAFTYHSADPNAWAAVGIALDYSRLSVTGLWPVRSDGHMGHHSHPGNCEWDIVICCRPTVDTTPVQLGVTVDSWITAVAPLLVNDADRRNMELAITMATNRYAKPT